MFKDVNSQNIGGISFGPPGTSDAQFTQWQSKPVLRAVKEALVHSCSRGVQPTHN